MSSASELGTGRWTLNPRLRIRTQLQEGEPTYVLHDPDSDAYYQLGSDAFAVASAFDGRRDFEGVRARCRAEGHDIDADDLAAFAVELADAGLLVPEDETICLPRATGAMRSGAHAARPRRRGGWSRWLQLEIAALRPDAFFQRTLPWVRPLFGAPARAAALAVVALAAIVLGGNASTLQQAVAASLQGVASLALLWGVYAVVVVVHEMAHGYACALYGGRVRALGFLLLYGKPCAYCDVTDAWMLDKRQRIVVMAAGSFVELVLWAVATIVWRLAAPETALHATGLAVLTVCGIGTLFNFNPLLQLDGYYMLSDALGIPNLRARAFGYIRDRLRRRPGAAATARERRVFVVYGVLALAYSSLVLGYLGWKAHAWIGASWGGAGLAALWGGMLLVAARPLAGAAARTAGAVRRARPGRRLAFAVVVVLGAAALVFVRWPLKVGAECQILPLARTVVRAEVRGSIEAVRVREGQIVEPGAELLALATRDLDHALEAAGAEVEELMARRALLESGARQEELEVGRRRVEAAATRARFERMAYERARQGAEGDLVSRQSLEAAEREMRLAEEEERQASQALDLLAAGARPEEVRAMRARLEAVQAEVARLEDERARTRLRAPHRGQVLSPRPETLVGRWVERGDSLLVLADVGTMLLEIPVPEKDVADVRTGAPVRFKARSLPQHTFAGQVVHIAPAAERSARQRTVLVRSEIDNARGLLRPDTSGFAKIYCGERRLGAIVSRRIVRTLRTEFWTWW